MDSPGTKSLNIRFTTEQVEWIESKTSKFYTKSDVIRDLVDFTRGPKPEFNLVTGDDIDG